MYKETITSSFLSVLFFFFFFFLSFLFSALNAERIDAPSLLLADSDTMFLCIETGCLPH